VLGAKARAALRGEPVPNFEDVRAIAHAVLAHRIVPSFEAEADGIDARRIVDELVRDSLTWK